MAGKAHGYCVLQFQTKSKQSALRLLAHGRERVGGEEVHECLTFQKINSNIGMGNKDCSDCSITTLLTIALTAIHSLPFTHYD